MNSATRTLRTAAVRTEIALAALVMLPGSAAAHDWLTGLTSPTGEPCCREDDCPAVDHRYDAATGRLEVAIEGMWVSVDPSTLVAVPPPTAARTRATGDPGCGTG
jgi:hypothetical protein